MADWQGVFLDFYGTVAAGDRLAVEAICQQVIDDHGLSLPAGELASRWGDQYFAAIESKHANGFQLLVEIERTTLETTLAPLIGRVDVTRYIDAFNAYLSRPDLFDEIHEVMGRLPVPVCIVSNADERELRAAIAHHGLRPAHVVTSESARSYKPAAGIFQHALAATGWDPTRVIHVGDSLHSDVAGAGPLGITTAWVCRADRIKDIGEARPDHTWSDLRPLLELLSQR